MLGIDPNEVSERKMDSTDTSDTSDISVVQNAPARINLFKNKLVASSAQLPSRLAPALPLSKVLKIKKRC